MKFYPQKTRANSGNLEKNKQHGTDSRVKIEIGKQYIKEQEKPGTLKRGFKPSFLITALQYLSIFFKLSSAIDLPPEVDCQHRRNQRSKSAIERPKTDRFCAQLVEPARKCYE
jgi:hypothetical protein